MKLPKFEINTKPKYKKLEIDLEAIELFEIIEKKFENCFLFESLGEQSHTSRYTIIGFDPQMIVSAREKILKLETKEKTEEFEVDNPYFALREIFPQNILSRNYTGGLIGFIAYDAVSYFEPSIQIAAHKDFEKFKFGVYTDGVLIDKLTGEFTYFYYNEDRSGILKEISREQKTEEKREFKAKFFADSLNQSEHAEIVEKVKEDIRAGLIFQCEVGFKSEYVIEGNPIEFYKRLRKVNPSPHMYFVKFRKQIIIGASPELLFRLRSGEMETYPLAGTIARGKNEKEDQELAAKLLQDPKEIAEHSMLVDLHRNDIARVAKFGTVKVRNLMDIKRFSHVQHISSEIVGILGKGQDMYSALASNFPAGTLTGAPKIEAMKIINENEKSARGVYGGAVGHFGFNGDCTFAIAIRSLFVSGKEAYAQTCGGIVFDSVAKNEYEEIQRKLAPIRNVLSDMSS